jgi:hypothetical protein
MDGTAQLIQSDKGKGGYKGVHPHMGRYQAKCNTSPCHNSHLGTFDIPEDAAQSYLQHNQKEHPKELEKERVPRPVLLPVQEHLLIRSDKGKTGYKGVGASYGRYQAKCDTSPCHCYSLGSFGTPEEAAQAYLQHQQHNHNHQAAPPPCPKDEGRHGWLRMLNALHEQQQQPQPHVGDRISVHWSEEGQWFSGRVFEVSEDDSSYCVVYDDGDKQWHSWQDDWAPDWHVDDGKAVEVKEGGEKRKLSRCDGKTRKHGGGNQPEEQEQVHGGGKKRKHEHTCEAERLSDQLHCENQALKRCKQEFIEEDHAAMQQMLSAVEAAGQCSICCDT